MLLTIHAYVSICLTIGYSSYVTHAFLVTSQRACNKVNIYRLH